MLRESNYLINQLINMAKQILKKINQACFVIILDKTEKLKSFFSSKKLLLGQSPKTNFDPFKCGFLLEGYKITNFWPKYNFKQKNRIRSPGS